MAAIDDLESSYANLAARLKAVTANPKPSYQLDGESYSWTEYTDMLVRSLKSLKEQIQLEGSVFELRTRGLTR